MPQQRSITVRKAAPTDAPRIIRILEEIAAEGKYTAITKPWSALDQERYLAGLYPREAVHVAETSEASIVGYQVLELWAATLESMSHVGQIGTFIAAPWRGRGVGTALFEQTTRFALANGYSKFVIQVRAQNVAAQEFYRSRGFRECGRFTRQVRIANGDEDDEVLMEHFL